MACPITIYLGGEGIIEVEPETAEEAATILERLLGDADVALVEAAGGVMREHAGGRVEEWQNREPANGKLSTELLTEALVDFVRREGGMLRLKTIADAFPHESYATVAWVLSNLVRDKRLTRPRHGFYAAVGE